MHLSFLRDDDDDDELCACGWFCMANYDRYNLAGRIHSDVSPLGGRCKEGHVKEPGDGCTIVVRYTNGLHMYLHAFLTPQKS